MLDLVQRGSQLKNGDRELALPGRLPRLVRMPSPMTYDRPLPFQDSTGYIRDGVGVQER